jgi:hypothetical protein
MRSVRPAAFHNTVSGMGVPWNRARCVHLGWGVYVPRHWPNNAVLVCDASDIHRTGVGARYLKVATKARVVAAEAYEQCRFRLTGVKFVCDGRVSVRYPFHPPPV